MVPLDEKEKQAHNTSEGDSKFPHKGDPYHLFKMIRPHLIATLGAIEDFLGMPRTLPSREKRRTAYLKEQRKSRQGRGKQEDN